MQQTAHEPETNGTSEISSPPAAAHKTQKNYVAEGFQNKTKGEGLFNTITYFGVGYLGVTAASIFLTWLLRDTKTPVANGYNGMVNWLVKTSENLFPSAKWLPSFVQSNSSISTMFLGGTLVTVLPVKWLEDAKPRLVRWLDNMIYGKDKVATDPTLIAAHKEIEEAPKQTWKSVVFSRISAFIATYATSALLGSKDSPVSNLTGFSIDRTSIAAGRGMDKITHLNDYDRMREIDAIAAQHPDAKFSVLRDAELQKFGMPNGTPDKIASRVWSYVALDGMYTALTSISLFISTRFLGPMFDKRDADGKPIAAQSKTATPAAPANGNTPETEAAAPNEAKATISEVAARQRLAPERAQANAV